MSGLRQIGQGLALAAAFALPAAALAAGGMGAGDLSLIDGAALSGVKGMVGVNMAAGSDNAQLNARAISIGVGGGQAVAGVNAGQHVVLPASPAVYGGRAVIGGGAFAHSSGAISVNQASGAANAQANVISIGIAAQAVSDAALAQSVTVPAHALQKAQGARTAIVSLTAFEGARGIVQVNQSAGIGNVTANSFVLQIELGGH